MNTHHRDRLEILSADPQRVDPARPPLIFVHGAYTAAWCWQEHFLPYFAAAGYVCRAPSLSGHGGSRRRELLDSYSIDNYIADLAEAADALPAPPVLIGHSMGGFVVQKYLETHPAAAAILMCTVPPQGLAASAFGMMFGRPALFSDLNRLMSGGQVALDSLRDALFAQPIPVEDLMRYYQLAQPESHRAVWDMMLFALPRISRILEHLPRGRDDLLVLGAEYDHIIPPSLVDMTAHSFGVTPHFFSGMGHGLMLEHDWQSVADSIIGWLQTRYG